jgi:hypothetical protein
LASAVAGAFGFSWVGGAVGGFSENPGRLILVGGGEMFSDQVVGAVGNSLLMLNAADGLVLGDDIVNIRTKMITQRFIEETSTASKLLWRFIVVFLIPIILIVIGIARYMMRRTRREAYQRILEQTS